VIPLVYRSPLGGPRRFAEWTFPLKNCCGAYIIRSKSTGKVLYVGESHSSRLRETMLRHFHEWNDTPERKHYTYDPARVEVAFRLTPPSAAIATQDKLIQRLQPRDNTNCERCNEPF
jgi:excinuclease UvrABC nuclease subunit